MSPQSCGSDRVAEDERQRVGAVYERYARSRRKQHAWDAANVGNSAMQGEVAGAAIRLAGRDLLHSDVLDVGCGTAWWLARLAEAGVPQSRLFGIDILAPRIAAAQARLPEA